MSQGRSMELLTTRTIRRTAVARDYHILRVTQTRLLYGPALEPPVLPHETFTTRIFARPLLLRQMARHRPLPPGSIPIPWAIRITLPIRPVPAQVIRYILPQLTTIIATEVGLSG